MAARSPSPSLADEPAAGGTALLVIDMISSWEFPDAEKLVPGAREVAPRIAALQARCRRAGVPVIYANDNYGRWRSDFRVLIEESRARGSPAAAITEQLVPAERDYFVLKPKHSAFFQTPVELLLQHLEVHTLWLTGVSGDQCVLATANDAKMRDYQVVVPADCIASQTAERHRSSVRYFDEVVKIKTALSTRLRMPRRGSA
jgi:nicotinamidase-related amidase